MSQSRPVKLTDTAITSKIVLAILYPFFLRLKFQGGLYAHLLFTEVLRIQTPVLLLAEQDFELLSQSLPFLLKR